jgi:hypothetical protein
VKYQSQLFMIESEEIDQNSMLGLKLLLMMLVEPERMGVITWAESDLKD